MPAPTPLDQLRGLSDRGVPWGRFSGPLLTAGRGEIPAAVLMLFGNQNTLAVPPTGPDDLDLLFVERASTLREHPGQVAFPGGRIDPDDGGPIQAALREAWEETAVDPGGVHVLGELDSVPLPVSNYQVTPVLGWWREPSPIRAVDPGESARVFRVPVSELIEPANRVSVTMNRGGESVVGPAFTVEDTLIWGFTGIILSDVLGELGWDLPWDRANTIDLFSR